MFGEERVSAAELQRRGERSETVRQVLCDLADRVYWYCCDLPQEADTVVLARARAMGWVPWHERPCPEQDCDAQQLGCKYGAADYRMCPRYRRT
jgi:hypothetical protein